ncbi:MAG: mechanosensitive ion channel protein MscS [Verrucomicrobia bacterium]|nr:MAG: mechanosensitive ion channel protein MscS [Verrucomicrobiota bacterium]
MKVQDQIINFFVNYGFQLVGAIIILLVGVLLMRWIGSALNSWLERKDMEPPLRKLIVRIVKVLVLLFTVVIVLDKCGVPVTTLVAGIGVAGLGIGLALQGVLGNLVAGLVIIFTKPFRVGEYVELLTVNGLVTDIELFSTTLVHTDRSRVVIPNRKIIGEILHNYGVIRQLDLTVNVAYKTNLPEALRITREVLNRNSRILKDPGPVVGIIALADSGITLAVKPWVSVSDYVPAGAEIYQEIVERFRASQIEIPFPQRDVRLLDTPNAA